MNIKIVTAFFDIGRGEFKTLSRSEDRYFEYFKFWARIKNDLTVYCQSQNADRIMEIRKQYGLENKTHLVIVDDFFNIEPEILKRMRNVECNEKFTNFRLFNEGLSNKANYCYVMLLKWWCLYDAARNEDANQMMAWLDFGYNHGGELYSKPEDFSFEWDYEFDNKINKFCLMNPDDVCGVDNLQFQSDCFIGHTAVMPAYFCKLYWEEIKDSMECLLSLDCLDDDQQLELMVYKKHPEWFCIRICNWFEDMMMCSNHHFDIVEKSPGISIKAFIRSKILKAKRKYSFFNRVRKRYNMYGR